MKRHMVAASVFTAPRLSPRRALPLRAVSAIGAASLLLMMAGVLAPAAGADTVGPINFEPSQGYALGDITGQPTGTTNTWSKTGSYDVAVATVSDFSNASGFGFGSQALRLSDAVTSGSFGDQTFSPGLSSPAGEPDLGGLPGFQASFTIGSTQSTQQGTDANPLHMSVSPDNGQGARMSYLRFEDQSDGIHVFFDDATDPGPGTVATFNEKDIATLNRMQPHTVTFVINFVNGPGNDVVHIYIDGALKATGTTWEDYYRYDPEQTPIGNVVPTVSKLLFRESGTADTGNAGNGFLVDNVSLTSSSCTPTGLYRDGINLTTALLDPTSPVTGTVNATGCNIGVYYGPGSSGGSVSEADISWANYYGVVDNAAIGNVDVTNSSIHNIGENPSNGTQHGVDVYYTTLGEASSGVDNNGVTTGPAATGTLSGSTISLYQKNGVVVNGSGASATVQGNTVTGNGMINYIAQNGVEIARGASALVKGNTVSGNWYTPATVTACGLLFYQAGGVKQQANTLFANQTNVCNAGRGGGIVSG